MKQISVVTYNIHRAISLYRKRDITEEIHQLLLESRADIICLQEVWRSKKTRESRLEKLLEDVWGSKAHGQNAIFPTGSQGNVILSRFAISEFKHHLYGPSRTEPRGWLYSKIRTQDNCFLYVICTHLGLRVRERKRQLGELLHYTSQLDPEFPLIIAGDFNDWDRRCHLRMQSEGFYESQGLKGPARTFPAFFPLLKLDRIYVRGLKVRAGIRLLKNRPSDHVALYGEFDYSFA